MSRFTADVKAHVLYSVYGYIEPLTLPVAGTNTLTPELIQYIFIIPIPA